LKSVESKQIMTPLIASISGVVSFFGPDSFDRTHWGPDSESTNRPDLIAIPNVYNSATSRNRRSMAADDISTADFVFAGGSDFTVPSGVGTAIRLFSGIKSFI